MARPSLSRPRSPKPSPGFYTVLGLRFPISFGRGLFVDRCGRKAVLLLSLRPMRTSPCFAYSVHKIGKGSLGPPSDLTRVFSLAALLSPILQRGPSLRPEPTGAVAFPLPCLGGTRMGEEVRDGPHGDNRGSGNRGGVAPTAAPLRPQAGVLRGVPAVIMLLLLAASRALSFPHGAAFALPPPNPLSPPRPPGVSGGGYAPPAVSYVCQRQYVGDVYIRARRYNAARPC